MVDVNIQVINSPLVNENKNMAPSLNSKMFFVRSVSDYLAINTKTLVCLTKEQKSNKTHMKVFQQNRYHASLTKKKSSLINLVLWKQFPYTPHFLQNIISVYQIRCFLWSNWIILWKKQHIRRYLTSLRPESNQRTVLLHWVRKVVCRSDVLSDFLPQTRKDDFLSLQLSINGIHRNIPGIGD